MKIVVDRAKCIGAANCVGIASRTFRLDDQKKAVLMDASAHEDEIIFEAAESCPTEAILLYDGKSGEKVFP